MKIKKAATARHEATLNPFLRNFISKASTVPVNDLLPTLAVFPLPWSFPRGDLYHWIPLLDRFDGILEEFVGKYKLKDGPQTIPFEAADKEVLIGVMEFTRLLVENCGNRSLYASSGHLGDVLCTTDLDVLYSCLFLCSRLAQRYYTSRTRGSSTSNQATLLASHYNINLDRVLKIAAPFPKGLGVAEGHGGKHVTTKTTLPVYCSDLVRIARGDPTPQPTSPAIGKGKGKASEVKEGTWEDWGSAWISYYKNPKVPASTTGSGISAPLFTREPVTPSPARRSSLHQSHTQSSPAQQTSPTAHRHRGTAPSAPTEESTETSTSSSHGGLQTLEISHSYIQKSANLEDLIKETIDDLPPDSHYEFLHRIRIASAMAGGAESRRKILGIRILAIINLAYVHPEAQFIQKILVADADEPRRLQLAFQFAEFLQASDGPGKDGKIPRWLQTLAIMGLEALARHKARLNDVTNALSLNVNHGVLLYLVRKVVAELRMEDGFDGSKDAEQWRDALFTLLAFLPAASPNTGSLMVSAGLIPLYVEMINLRTPQARRYVASKVIGQLDNLIYSAPNAFQTFASAQGLDSLVDLVSQEVKAGLEEIERGEGILDDHRSESTDYKITHLRQQILKTSSKFMHHIMSQSGTNIDRLLRNLVDNPKLLEAIRLVISRGDVWGSNIWSTIVAMISTFINNEPTSYAVVHEAHITHALLEAITGRTGLVELEARKKKEQEEKEAKEKESATTAEASSQGAQASSSAEASGPSSSTANPAPTANAAPAPTTLPTETKEPSPEPETEGETRAPAILPSQDAIGCIANAFGAICLNASGLNLIKISNALDSFFEIFESPAHVKVLGEGDLDNLLGGQFDELIRHHPPLREKVMSATLRMLKRVTAIGEKYAQEKGVGAKIWLQDDKDELIVSGGRSALNGNAQVSEKETKSLVAKDSEGDAVMADPDASSTPSVVATDKAPEVPSTNDVVKLSDVLDEEAEGTNTAIVPIVDYVDVASRFVESLVQNPNQAREFVRRGGLETVLGFYRLPSLPHDFATSQANQTICRAVHFLCEHSMSDTLKAVYINANAALQRLKPYLKHSHPAAFFAPLTDPNRSDAPKNPEGADRSYNVEVHGTTLIKNLVAVHSVVYLLQDLYHQSFFTVRQSVQVFLETSQDVDREALICQLGMLQRQCVWEEILLQNHIPTSWDQATRVRDSVSSAAAAIDEAAARQTDAPTGDKAKDQKKDQKAIVEKDGKTSWFRNVKTIRYLIGQIPTVINPFLQGLAKCVVTRRTQDLQHKYLALKLVDAISDVIYTHLTWERINTAALNSQKHGYLIVMLSSVMTLLLDGLAQDVYFNTPKLTPPDQNVIAITTTVITFKQKNGFEVIKKILNTFWEDLKVLPAADTPDLPQSEQERMLHAYGGIRIILSLFSYLVSPKCVVDSVQSVSLHNRSIADYFGRPDYFNANQLLVELRHTILPVVAEMWEASTLEKASTPMIKTVIEILGTILKGESEGGAFTRNDLSKQGLNNTLFYRDLMPRDTRVKHLMDMGYTRDASLEALRRSGDDLDEAATLLGTSAEELDRAAQEARRGHDDMEDEDAHDEDDDESESEGDEDGESDNEEDPEPVQVTAENPQGHPQPPPARDPAPAPAQPEASASGEAQTPTPIVPIAEGADAELAVPPPPPAPPITRVRIDDLLAPLSDSPATAELIARLTGTTPPTNSASRSSTDNKGKDKEVEKKKPVYPNVCVEDLEEMRSKVRENLIERCLDVLQLHNDTTFELADLIKSAFANSPLDQRKDVVSIVSMSLLSFQGEEDIRPKGKTISSMAHLLGLILQDQAFYEASSEDLKDHFEYLVNFIKIYPGEPAPWVATVLLVLEKLLAESSQPDKLKFNPTKLDEEPTVENAGIKISEEDQLALFDALMAVLPNVDKDEILSFSIVRVIVLLTRRRDLAIKLMEGGNLQKLLHMYRRQAGNRVEKLQSNLMIIMRHIVEDEETLKAIMRAEIRTAFTTRGTRPLDTGTFAKQLSHLILRSPDTFVDVANELLKIARYESHLRNQVLVLKEQDKPKEASAETGESKPEESKFGESSGSAETKDAPAEGEAAPEPMEVDEKEKPKPTHELRAPGVENPDGVIHFLITELFAIKDVRDYVPQPAGKTAEPATSAGLSSTEQTGEESSASTPAPGDKPAETTKPEKQEVKAEDHPFYFYRAFILMALAELVCCYNRCKIEFINFNRKAGAREPITPSKPRSAIFNYLLNDLIIQHALSTGDDIEKKKRSVLAEWSQGIFVSLCTHTGENPEAEEEQDLLFVRKFVCEVSLKAFKDACASPDPLDVKYPRMWALSETFYRILCGRPQSAPTYAANTEKTQLQMAKIMLDKNYVSALTSALAEVDLNFPDASRKYIKYMLKTLRLLSKRAVDLSETSSISTPGTTDEDEIMTASSMTDIDDIREETPDLYRNSTLGLFEGADVNDDDEETESYDEGDEDEDMMYDDDMGFEEEIIDEDGSEISDDEDEGGDDMDVEIVVEGEGPHGDDDDDDDSDDEEDMDEDGDEIILEGHDHHHHHDDYDEDEDDEEGWESDGNDEEDELDEDPDGVIGDRLENIARALAGGEEEHEMLQHMDDDREDGFIDDEMDDEDDMEGDEDEDEMEDDEAMLEEDFDEDEDAHGHLPWGWAEGDDAALLTRTHPRGTAGGWFTLSGQAREPPTFMSFAARGGPRGGRHFTTGRENPRDASNQNPLLQQAVDAEQPMHRRAQHRFGPAGFMTDWPIDSLQPGESPVSVINTLMNLMNRGAVPAGAIHFETNIPLGRAGFPHSMHRDMRSLFGHFRPMADPTRHRVDADSVLSGTFEAATTSIRWVEEARLLYGVRIDDYAQRIVNTLLWKMVPAALEEEKIRKEKEEAEKKRIQELEEEMRKKQEEERLAKEKAEAEEKARKEEEERQAAEQARIEAEARAAEAAESAGAATEGTIEGGTTTQAGEGATETQGTASAEAGSSQAPVERATVVIRDREIDITGMGIDPEFLAAIPEDMREEALTAHIRERRAEAATSNQPSEISREFLEALPEDIREELLASESADRRRREQETARAANGGGPVDIDLASFLATLEPTLRQTVLLEQDEEALAQLPHDIVEEANRLRIDRGIHNHFPDMTRVRGGTGGRRDEPPPPKKPVRKGTIQLLDKSGVATLLRLMFVPQQTTTRGIVSEILLNICENRQNRAEVVNLLLSILQDGSADMQAVERSFAQLSARAKQTNTQKTPVKPGLHRINTTSGVLAQTSGDISPLMVTQQCLAALYFLVSYNEHIPSYFLTEHDTSTGLKRSLSRKGKGKAVESKANKFALNTLLGLLDRPLITESTTVMEQLSVLLSEITRPLTILLKKDKKKDEEEKPKEETAEARPEQAGEGAATTTETTAQPEAATSAGETSATTTAPVEGSEQPTETTSSAPPPPGPTDSATAPTETAEGSSTDKPNEPAAEEEKPKKARNLVPPVVPEHNLRLVVNILTARECSSKTYRETIATMQNLSGIPGAKDVFGIELIRQAEELSNILIGHLDALVQQIKKAENGTQVQGMALASFSPASSEQAKLLRVLTAIDYLFDPKRNPKQDSPNEKTEKEGEAKTEEVDVLSKLHQQLAFSPLWEKLSECLRAIHEREDMLHIATILLPSMESLMVVCKTAGLDEKEQPKAGAGGPNPEVVAATKKLFFSFTEEHRKILNQMVRNNPKLMSGTFAQLMHNPKVLDFDNKRNFFTRKLHARQGIRESHPTLQLNVRRDQVFMDSYRSMYYKSGDEIKYAKLSIRFSNEEGVDAGGVTREWFQVMARQMFNPGYALFVPVASDRTTFHPNHLSGVNSEHLQFFKFIGRIIGKALYEGRVLDCHFSRAVYKQILGKSVSLKDMETLDLDYYKSMLWMLENDITDVITETFSSEVDEFGVQRTIDLIPNGRNIPVTEENKHEFVRLNTEHRLLHSVKEQIDAFLQGFYDIVPANLISIFNEQELELLISGMPEIDLDDWKNNTEYHNYTASSPQIQWFWRAVRSFDKEERAKLLQFVTGTSKVPLNGFKELEGMNGFSKFNIHRDYGNKDRLPSSHTCFNQLDLPEYESYEALRQQLLTAITQGAEYFGFA